MKNETRKRKKTQRQRQEERKKEKEKRTRAEAHHVGEEVEELCEDAANAPHVDALRVVPLYRTPPLSTPLPYHASASLYRAS
eukprot:1374910-Rhodomonas_salina.1